MTERGGKQVFCELCKVYIPSAGLLEAHNKGKKHGRLVRLNKQREDSAKRSVFVNGFNKSGNLEKDLTEYFEQYGAVENVFVDKDKGKYAIVMFKEVQAAVKVLGVKQLPLLDGQHIKVKERKLTTVNFEQKQRSHQHDTQDNTKDKEKKGKSSNQLVEFFDHDLVERLKQLNSIKEQMSELTCWLQLSDSDMKMRQLICQLLEEVLTEVFSGAKVVPFGSTANNFGLQGTDLDICLLVEEPINMEDLLTDSSGHLQAGEKDPVSPGMNQLYDFIADILRRLVPGCSQVVPLLSARCPVIKFTHQTSGLHCDLSINNRLGIENTALLKKYAEIDARVRPLIYTVRAWAKAKGLSGRGGGQLSNYALTLMILYYLQVMSNPVLPCLQDLASWPASHTHDFKMKEQTLEGWDCSYVDDIRALSKSENVDVAGDLLCGFFVFYGSRFDYGNCVVSACSGKRSLKEEVTEELQQMGESVVAAFKVTPLCVQDPFELNHNVAANLTEIGLRKFVQECMDARRHLESAQKVTNSQMREEHFPGLLKLFTASQKRKQKSLYSFYVPYQETCMSESSNTQLEGPMTVWQSVLVILKEELGIMCSMLDDSSCDSLNLVPTVDIQNEPATSNTETSAQCSLGTSLDKTCDDSHNEERSVSNNSDRQTSHVETTSYMDTHTNETDTPNSDIHTENKDTRTNNVDTLGSNTYTHSSNMDTHSMNMDTHNNNVETHRSNMDSPNSNLDTGNNKKSSSVDTQIGTDDHRQSAGDGVKVACGVKRAFSSVDSSPQGAVKRSRSSDSVSSTASSSVCSVLTDHHGNKLDVTCTAWQNTWVKRRWQRRHQSEEDDSPKKSAQEKTRPADSEEVLRSNMHSEKSVVGRNRDLDALPGCASVLSAQNVGGAGSQRSCTNSTTSADTSPIPKSGHCRSSAPNTVTSPTTDPNDSNYFQGTSGDGSMVSRGSSPVLVFQLYLSNSPSVKCEKGSSSQGCFVNLGLVSCTSVDLFSNFFAFFKKELQSKLGKKT